MLAQTVTPDTTGYLFLALGIFFALLGVFVLSMVVRARNLRRDEEVIEQLRSEK
jgi:phosphotransferase system  glucose/maltose/N-acetylglucosamine-specific IIC component